MAVQCIKDAKAVGSCRCYLEVLEQDAKAGDGGCCYLPAWEQDVKMVGFDIMGSSVYGFPPLATSPTPGTRRPTTIPSMTLKRYLDSTGSTSKRSRETTPPPCHRMP
ncbi:hypothetical protein GW17_00006151 [Ensete ventricosum]|nr:hypothetical protein GW17_00006151 [Ensete ventricosum]